MKNAPAYDLVDEDKKIFVQVTSSHSGREKVQKTIDGLIKHEMPTQYKGSSLKKMICIIVALLLSLGGSIAVIIKSYMNSNAWVGEVYFSKIDYYATADSYISPGNDSFVNRTEYVYVVQC